MSKSEPMTQRYARGADAVVRGDFGVSLTELPEVATRPNGVSYGDLDLDGKLPTHQWVEQAERGVRSPYKHIAWWAFQAFYEAAGVDVSVSNKDMRYFNPSGGAGILGFISMSRHVQNITSVYGKQMGILGSLPDCVDDQAQQVAEIALRSADDLETVAAQNVAVGGRLERAIGLSGAQRAIGADLESANHILALVNEGGADTVRVRHLDRKTDAERESYLRAMEKEGQEPQRHLGCFALKAGVASDAGAVFFRIWHGIVMGARQNEVIQTHLREIHAHHEVFGYDPVPDMPWR